MLYLVDAGLSISYNRCCRIWRCGQLAKIGKGFSNLEAWDERVNREINGGEIWNAIRCPGPHYPSYKSAASMRSVPLRQVTSRAEQLPLMFNGATAPSALTASQLCGSEEEGQILVSIVAILVFHPFSIQLGVFWARGTIQTPSNRHVRSMVGGPRKFYTMSWLHWFHAFIYGLRTYSNIKVVYTSPRRNLLSYWFWIICPEV